MHRIILASGSPRRKEIFEQVGINFEIITSDKEENMDKDNPEELVKDLSKMKALDVAQKVDGPCIIVGADTVVAKDNLILGKPKNKEEATEMIRLLQNDSHEVYTGVYVLIKENSHEIQELSFAVSSKVKVASMNQTQIDDYVKTNEPMDKAGAYAIQGKFAPYIVGIEGDYYNIVGFPISRLYQELYAIGINLLS